MWPVDTFATELSSLTAIHGISLASKDSDDPLHDQTQRGSYGCARAKMVGKQANACRNCTSMASD